jgi:hypothetical protein
VDGVEELGHVGHPLLEQVAHAGTDQLGRVSLLDVLRQHEHREPGMPGTQLDRGAQAVVGVGGRHPHVDDGQVGIVRGDRVDQARRVSDRRDGLDRAVRQQPYEAFPEQHGILGDHHPHRVTTLPGARP